MLRVGLEARLVKLRLPWKPAEVRPKLSTPPVAPVLVVRLTTPPPVTLIGASMLIEWYADRVREWVLDQVMAPLMSMSPTPPPTSEPAALLVESVDAPTTIDTSRVARLLLMVVAAALSTMKLAGSISQPA